MRSFTERILILCDVARTFERALAILNQRIREQAEREPTNQALQYINSISRPAGIVDYLAAKEGSREYHELIQSIRDEELHFNPTTQGINRRSLAYQKRKRHTRQAGKTTEQLQEAFDTENSKQNEVAHVIPNSNLMTMAKLKQIPDLERDFITRYRSIMTVGPGRKEIEKYLANPANYEWPSGPDQVEAERQFFKNYEPDEL